MSVELAKQRVIFTNQSKVDAINEKKYDVAKRILEDGTISEIEELLDQQTEAWSREMDIPIEYHDLTLTSNVPTEQVIPTVLTMLSSMLLFWKTPNTKEIDILSHLTGRVLPRKMTLIIGPPGCGKSVFLKALAGQLVPLGGAKLSGEVYYDGDNISSGKFIPTKVADYIEQGDTHEAVITVDETFKFAWKCSSGGHHSYASAKDEEAAKQMDLDDKDFALVQNLLTLLGLRGCKDTYVGNGTVRGVSGGQKRRVTIGEMMACPRPIKMMDCISNGLDTATTYDIIRASGAITKRTGATMVIALLQPPPDVYNLFEEIILMSEGCIIYHGPREHVMAYFANLGYVCPPLVDDADFLQELPTPEGARFRTASTRVVHHAKALEAAWRSSALYQNLLSDLQSSPVKATLHQKKKEWFADYKEPYAKGFWFYFVLCLERQMKVIVRDMSFTVARVAQCLLLGAISGSLFVDIGREDVSTMNGFLFNTLLFCALGGFAVLPTVYDQKAVFYKQKASLFFPSSAYTLAQTVSLLPLQLLEVFLYITICYWSAGLSDDYNGSRFLIFILISFVCSVTLSQVFRVIAVLVSDLRGAIPVSSLIIVIMILFSGYIQPKALISDGWMWFYWINPVAWALKAATLNEFSSPKYDFQTCVNPTCTATKRFGDFVLEQYGNPTNEDYIWYSMAVMLGEFIIFFLLTAWGLEYVSGEVLPAPPIRAPDLDDSQKQVLVDVETGEHAPSAVVSQQDDHESSTEGVPISDPHFITAEEQLPFDPLSFAFKDIWYTVTLPKGGNIDLLQGVNGYIEPGSVTALMGSSGAGKTTLLDVLAGRKNTGVVKGEMYLNGVPKVEAYFRKIMGYVEQFDTLPQKSTGREAIAFSAALRLPAKITVAQREKWVNAILKMLDLQPLQDALIGSMTEGGMTFEQRKRVSIGVELAANPSILFLDEPTTGLDSRAALSLIRNIRNVAASGRSIVCTIHQPSAAIFDAFDALLLLRRGGQTVYFGPLGHHAKDLVHFFEAAPGVAPISQGVNPATWMLDVIGAGTSTVTNATADYHAHYNASSLCQANLEHLSTLTVPLVNSRRLTADDVTDDGSYNVTYWQQFGLLMHRIALTYWRTPTYSLLRHLTNILIALIFASAYPRQSYHTYVATVSRAAVIFITSLFCGMLAMLTITPVLSAERPAYYREQQSRMYSPGVYCATLVLIELPYLQLASLSFTLPFFYIVGFDNVGNVPQKFMWYWFFNFLLQGAMLFIGELFVVLAPDEPTTHVLVSFMNEVLSLFCGFMIAEQSFPPFWLFMYWINPLHYALEGLITSQFHGDTTKIKMMDGSITTAEHYINHVQFTTWSYDHIGYDVLALGGFIFLSIVGMYICLRYLRHDKR